LLGLAHHSFKPKSKERKPALSVRPEYEASLVKSISFLRKPSQKYKNVDGVIGITVKLLIFMHRESLMTDFKYSSDNVAHAHKGTGNCKLQMNTC